MPIHYPFEAEVSQLKWEKMSKETAERLASIVQPFASYAFTKSLPEKKAKAKKK